MYTFERLTGRKYDVIPVTLSDHPNTVRAYILLVSTCPITGRGKIKPDSIESIEDTMKRAIDKGVEALVSISDYELTESRLRVCGIPVKRRR